MTKILAAVSDMVLFVSNGYLLNPDYVPNDVYPKENNMFSLERGLGRQTDGEYTTFTQLGLYFNFAPHAFHQGFNDG